MPLRLFFVYNDGGLVRERTITILLITLALERPHPRTSGGIGVSRTSCIGPRMWSSARMIETDLLHKCTLRTIVINLLRLNGYKSLKTAMVKLVNRIYFIFSLLT